MVERTRAIIAEELGEAVLQRELAREVLVKAQKRANVLLNELDELSKPKAIGDKS